jgi:hypothetical protein
MADMEQQIEHCHLPIRGLNLHVAQAGKGQPRLLVFIALVLAQLVAIEETCI